MEGRLQSRRAIEALRAGVPNRDAVRVLGLSDRTLAQRFDSQLERLAGDGTSAGLSAGLLLAAEFGGGKSHALEYLKHCALESNFAVSKVVISKETQLFDPARLFRSAIESLEVEDRAGDVLADIVVTRLKNKEFSDRFNGFSHWLRDSQLNSRFEATLALFEDSKANPELQDRLIRFWAGGPLAMTQLRKDLRACGLRGFYSLEKINAKDLAREKFHFAAGLIRAAGYDGWVLLLDELELIGRYSILQRGRSYAELARLLALDEREAIAGMLTVGAITPDVEGKVLFGKDDINQIGFRFRARGDHESDLTAALAEQAMDRIRKDLILLRKPDPAALAETQKKLADIYAQAYGVAPQTDGITFDAVAEMRAYIRSWITTWDLNRLEPDKTVDIVVTPPEGTDFSELTALERASPDDDE